MTVTADSTAFVQEIREHFARVADDAVQALFVDMEQNGPRSDSNDHEHMTSIVELVDSDDSGDVLTRTIRSPAEYSSFVDEGTAAHEIRGRPLLAFTASDGSRVIVYSVQHPGTQRTGWWTDRLARWGEYVAQAMGR